MEYFFCSAFGPPQSGKELCWEETIIPLHLPDGETEAWHQPSFSQRCLTGERQHSLNPAGHRAQTHSQQGAIPMAGGWEWQLLPSVAGMWLGGCSRQC